MRTSRHGAVVVSCMIVVARAAYAQPEPSPSAPTQPQAPQPTEPAPPSAPPAPVPETAAPPHEEAHEPSDDEQTSSLALQLTNPVADLASVPFQFNWNNGLGPNDELL